MDHYYKTFVSVGNAKQHYTRLLNAIAENIELLPKPILIQCGHTPFKSDYCEVVQFINMDKFVEHVANAEILVLHAGAGSVLHSVRAGKRPILMPRRAKFNEHVNDHQVGFAQTLCASGKAIMVDDKEELRCGIQAILNHGIKSIQNDGTPPAFGKIRDRLKRILGE